MQDTIFQLTVKIASEYSMKQTLGSNNINHNKYAVMLSTDVDDVLAYVEAFTGVLSSLPSLTEWLSACALDHPQTGSASYSPAAPS